jgi:hypothetical protein
VHRATLLTDVQCIMARYAAADGDGDGGGSGDGGQRQRFASMRLEVQFFGESGFHVGVTRGFFTDTARALQRLATNAAVPMWVHEPEEKSAPVYLRAGAAGGLGAGAGGGGGLFPQPLPRGHPLLPAVCARFRMLGRLFAVALRDQVRSQTPDNPPTSHSREPPLLRSCCSAAEQLVSDLSMTDLSMTDLSCRFPSPFPLSPQVVLPLPLSLGFLKLAQGQAIGDAHLPLAATLGGHVRALNEALCAPLRAAAEAAAEAAGRGGAAEAVEAEAALAMLRRVATEEEFAVARLGFPKAAAMSAGRYLQQAALTFTDPMLPGGCQWGDRTGKQGTAAGDGAGEEGAEGGAMEWDELLPGGRARPVGLAEVGANPPRTRSQPPLAVLLCPAAAVLTLTLTRCRCRSMCACSSSGGWRTGWTPRCAATRSGAWSEACSERARRAEGGGRRTGHSTVAAVGLV